MKPVPRRRERERAEETGKNAKSSVTNDRSSARAGGAGLPLMLTVLKVGIERALLGALSDARLHALSAWLSTYWQACTRNICPCCPIHSLRSSTGKKTTK